MKNTLLITLIALLSACASNVKTPDVPVEDNQGAPAAPTSAPSAQTAVTPIKVDDLSAIKQGPANVAKVIYFDFDSFVVKPEFQNVLEAHARFLRADRNRRVNLEGHTDERGGREYNLALGQKRSEAVRRALTALGVPDAQMEAVSFGKEKPAATGGSEDAYSKNRRVEMTYR